MLGCCKRAVNCASRNLLDGSDGADPSSQATEMTRRIESLYPKALGEVNRQYSGFVDAMNEKLPAFDRRADGRISEATARLEREMAEWAQAFDSIDTDRSMIEPNRSDAEEADEPTPPDDQESDPITWSQWLDKSISITTQAERERDASEGAEKQRD